MNEASQTRYGRSTCPLDCWFDQNEWWPASISP